jgi:hypothetical protein
LSGDSARRLHALAAAPAASFGACRCVADGGGLFRGEVVAIQPAVLRVLERRAVRLPLDGQRSELHRAGDFAAHLLVLLVAGIRLQPVLRAHRRPQHCRRHRRARHDANQKSPHSLKLLIKKENVV